MRPWSGGLPLYLQGKDVTLCSLLLCSPFPFSVPLDVREWAELFCEDERTLCRLHRSVLYRHEFQGQLLKLAGNLRERRVSERARPCSLRRTAQD